MQVKLPLLLYYTGSWSLFSVKLYILGAQVDCCGDIEHNLTFTAGHSLPMLVACVAELQRGIMGRSIGLFFGALLCLGLSALVCTKNIPEKWNPGSTFDIVHSHALMHVLVYLEYYFEWLFICHHVHLRTLAATGE